MAPNGVRTLATAVKGQVRGTGRRRRRGRVTTRSVAERAGPPHGSVSYHFRGKQQLTTESATHAFADALPRNS